MRLMELVWTVVEFSLAALLVPSIIHPCFVISAYLDSTSSIKLSASVVWLIVFNVMLLILVHNASKRCFLILLLYHAKHALNLTVLIVVMVVLVSNAQLASLSIILQEHVNSVVKDVMIVLELVLVLTVLMDTIIWMDCVILVPVSANSASEAHITVLNANQDITMLMEWIYVSHAHNSVLIVLILILAKVVLLAPIFLQDLVKHVQLVIVLIVVLWAPTNVLFVN